MGLSMKTVIPLLKKKGFSDSVIHDMRMAFISDAVENSGDIHADRIYTLVALMLHNTYGFEHEEIFRGLECFDELSQRAADGWEWPDIMDTLYQETSVVISTNSDDRIAFEYLPH